MRERLPAFVVPDMGLQVSPFLYRRCRVAKPIARTFLVGSHRKRMMLRSQYNLKLRRPDGFGTTRAPAPAGGLWGETGRGHGLRFVPYSKTYFLASALEM